MIAAAVEAATSPRAAPHWIVFGVALVAGRMAGLPLPAAGGVALAGWGATLQLAAMLRTRRTPPAALGSAISLQGLLYGSLAWLCLAADWNATPGEPLRHALSMAMGAAVAVAIVRLAARGLSEVDRV
ncbi:hypothetical protein [Pirellulimonas nuda]|nr:hypothetical protein [Pirellulimonas nuda]